MKKRRLKIQPLFYVSNVNHYINQSIQQHRHQKHLLVFIIFVSCQYLSLPNVFAFLILLFFVITMQSYVHNSFFLQKGCYYCICKLDARDSNFRAQAVSQDQKTTFTECEIQALFSHNDADRNRTFLHIKF